MIRILVIDDDQHMRAACMRALSRAGWSAVAAGSGDEGIQLLRAGTQQIDVVLLDQLMPGMTGMEALQQIRSLDPKLPIIIIAGSMIEEDIAAIKRQGAFDCLPKPFNPEQLREMIRKAVDSHPR